MTEPVTVGRFALAFDAQGRERPELRRTGYISAEELLGVMHTLQSSFDSALPRSALRLRSGLSPELLSKDSGRP